MRCTLDEARVELEALDPVGFAVVMTAPSQQALAAQRLSPALGDPPVLDGALLPEPLPAGTAIVVGLPDEEALRVLNGRRDFLTLRGHRLVFFVDLTQFQRLQADAGDLVSVLRLVLELEALPVEVDTATTLRQHRAWLAARYGRLDLRGFARSEAEDVSWTALEAYEELEVTLPEGGYHWLMPASEALQARERLVLLGHPGTGKTFFLRWLALADVARTEAWGEAATLPVLAPLSSYAREGAARPLVEHLRDHLLRQGLASGHLLLELARAGRACFLLDGLDEGGDPGLRRRVAAGVEELARDLPRCPVVVTSRITGYDEAPLPWPAAAIEPLSGPQIRSFLARWCGLYAVARHGDEPGIAEEGRREGLRLADDVLRHPQVTELARSPLMLTVLAMVHRAGLRLPDHRVELYDHLTRILVERWNRLRGLHSDGRAPPIKSADAVRLLGPVALDVVRRDAQGALPEAELRRGLELAIDGGRMRSIGSADEALRLFRDELGLLVEQGPGTWAFLHLTLAEYFAAWELVRTGGLEMLVRDPGEAFQARYREVLLLAAGELGVLRAEDSRLATVVDTLLAAARRRRGRPSSVVPFVLGGLLADDPGLSPATASKLVDELVPRWWFERAYGRSRQAEVVREAARDLGPRVLVGRHGDSLRAALARHFVAAPTARLVARLGEAGPSSVGAIVDLLRAARLDPSPLLRTCLAREGKPRDAARLAWIIEGRVQEDGAIWLWLPAALDAEVAARTLQLRVGVPVRTQVPREALVEIERREHWRIVQVPQPPVSRPPGTRVRARYSLSRRTTPA